MNVRSRMINREGGMKILVTGAAGNVGSRTVNQFSQMGFEVIAFDLPNPSNRRKLNRLKKRCAIRWGDILRYEDIEKVMDGVERVVHLAAIIPPGSEEHPELARLVNVEGTRNVIRACMNSKLKPWLLFSSSISVYGDRRSGPVIKTSDPLRPNDNYAEHKLICENIIRSAEGLNWQIFRLTAIFSSDNMKLIPYMFRMPLNTPLEICTAEDIAWALSSAVKCPQLLHTITNLAGGNECRTTYKEFIHRMLAIFGFGKTRFLPDSAFSSEAFHCGFMDTKNGEIILGYQRHNLESFYRQIDAKFKSRRFIVRVFLPLAKKILLNKSPYLKKG